MQKRFVSIWFRYLRTDWFIRRQPGLAGTPFILASPENGRLVATAVNALAQKEGISIGMAVADARALFPAIQVLDDKTALSAKLLKGVAEWCIRYTPKVAIDPPEGLILDVSGCAHLWGGEKPYLTEIVKRLNHFGYDVNAAMADTIGTAWAIARFSHDPQIIESGNQIPALLLLPPVLLRIDAAIVERLEKLGLRQVTTFIHMPRTALRRRFGPALLKRLDQALGHEEEWIDPVQPVEPFQERLHCMEHIVTATGIEIALEQLLESLCKRLQQEQKGLRSSIFKCFRVDGKIEKIEIGTNHASCNSKHLFKLFELKIASIEPALGIELFILEAPKVEDLFSLQEKLWNTNALLA